MAGNRNIKNSSNLKKVIVNLFNLRNNIVSTVIETSRNRCGDCNLDATDIGTTAYK